MQDFWGPFQNIIMEVCLDFDKHWQIRKRTINTHFLVLFIFKLVMSKNRQGYKSTLTELWEKPELKACQISPVSASSVCEARQKLPENIFTELNRAILQHNEKITPEPRWRGHRIFAADGSKIHLPRELLLAGYKAPNKGQYYPQGLLSVIYNIGSGFVHDCLLTNHNNERLALIQQMDILSEGDVLVLDRGYFSYLVLCQALKKNIHLICRLQSGSTNKAIEAFWNSDLNDSVIDYRPSAAVQSSIKKQGFSLDCNPIKLRLIKYKIDNEIYVCATTLIGENYPLDEFPKLYHGRWGIEELYKISKEFIDVEDFHGKTERGVKQELYAHVLLINIARLFEIEANKKLPPLSADNEDKNKIIKAHHWQDLFDGVKTLKINFKNCLLVISRFLEKLVMLAKDESDWLSEMLRSISRVRQKIRPGRFFPRSSRKPHTKWSSSGSNVNKLAGA